MECRQEKLEQTTEHLFRETYQEVFSSMAVKFGAGHIDLIEDSLQEAFYTALKSWKSRDYPKNPKGWLFTVARNHLLNELKRASKSLSFSFENTDFEHGHILTETKKDDQLRLLLACAKLKIHPKAKLVFTLKSICGFGVVEIANGLQISEADVYKNLQRGKSKLQQLPKAYFGNLNPIDFSEEDISYIESIVYFMFNEGYDSVSSTSETAINKAFCLEAVRLGQLLINISDRESSHHLLALFYFHMARFDSRLDQTGGFVSLRTQDRTKWDGTLIKIGFDHLIKPKSLNRFYIEALIASIHLQANKFSETDWEEILKLYNSLLRIHDTPIVRLNRAICLFELGKNEEAFGELQLLKTKLEESYLYYTVSMAEYLEDKDAELAKFWYQKSMEQTKQDFRTKIIADKLSKLG